MKCGAKQEEQLKIIQDNLNAKQREQAEIGIGKNKYIIFLLFTVIILGTLFYFIKDIGKEIIIATGCGSIILFLIIFIIDMIKNNKKKRILFQEIEVLHAQKRDASNAIKKVEESVSEIEKEIHLAEELEFRKMQNEFYGKLSEYEIHNILETSYQDNVRKIEEQEKIVKETELRLRTVEVKRENMNSQIVQLEKFELDLKQAKEKQVELENLRESIELAKEVLELSYQKAKDSITPKWKKNLENATAKISDGVYNMVQFSEEQGLQIGLGNGKLIPVECLSVGTIDQMYLALRINMLAEIVEERMPIILDEAFAYYDDNRLEQILMYLSEEYPDRQILILSCSNREYDALKGLNIRFNEIML